jgi:hypothetical protein
MPNAALSRAANKAKPVATVPTIVDPARKPTVPASAKTKPTNCAKRSGATGSRSLTGESRGADREDYGLQCENDGGGGQ